MNQYDLYAVWLHRLIRDLQLRLESLFADLGLNSRDSGESLLSHTDAKDRQSASHSTCIILNFQLKLFDSKYLVTISLKRVLLLRTNQKISSLAIRDVPESAPEIWMSQILHIQVKHWEFPNFDRQDRLSHENYTSIDYLLMWAFFKVNALDESKVNDRRLGK